MNLKHRHLVLALSCGALVAGCATEGTGPDGPSALQSEIVGVSWQLDGLAPTGQPFAAPPEGTFTLELAEAGELHLVADCNLCNGRYTLGDGTLEVDGGVLACTRAFCPSAPFDSDYVRLVASVRSWQADSSGLTLAGDEGRLRFERAQR